MSDPAVQQYLAALPPERGPLIDALRKIVVDCVPEGIVEVFDFGMLTYVVPLEVYPKTYNGKPLMHTALANQKNYVSLYLMGIYGDPGLKASFESQYRATGKRYDVGASCIRFRKEADIPRELIAWAISSYGRQDLIRMHEGAVSLRAARGKSRP